MNLLYLRYVRSREAVFLVPWTGDVHAVVYWVTGGAQMGDTSCIFQGALWRNTKPAGLPLVTFPSFFLHIPQFVDTMSAQCEGGNNIVYDLIVSQYSSFKIGRLLIKKDTYIALFL